MSTREPLASHDYQAGQVAAVLEFLKRTRNELRTLRKVHVYPDKLHVFDVNGDFFQVLGLGYPDADIVPVLQNINTNFKPQFIHNPIEAPYKEFLTGKRYAWAQDRVM